MIKSVVACEGEAVRGNARAFPFQQGDAYDGGIEETVCVYRFYV